MFRKKAILIVTATIIATTFGNAKAEDLEQRIERLENRVAILESSLAKLTDITKKIAFSVKNNSDKTKDIVLILKSMQQQNRRLTYQIEELKKNVYAKNITPSKSNADGASSVISKVKVGQREILIARRGVKKYILATVTNVSQIDRIWKAVQDIKRFGIPVYAYITDNGYLVLTTRTEPEKIKRLTRYLPYRPILSKRQNSDLGVPLTSKTVLVSLVEDGV